MAPARLLEWLGVAGRSWSTAAPARLCLCGLSVAKPLLISACLLPLPRQWAQIVGEEAAGSWVHQSSRGADIGSRFSSRHTIGQKHTMDGRYRCLATHTIPAHRYAIEVNDTVHDLEHICKLIIQQRRWKS